MDGGHADSTPGNAATSIDRTRLHGSARLCGWISPVGHLPRQLNIRRPAGTGQRCSTSGKDNRVAVSSMRREHTPYILGQLARQFPSKQRCGHKTGRIKRVHKLSHPEAIAKLLLARCQQHFDLLLSDKIAGPVARLL